MAEVQSEVMYWRLPVAARKVDQVVARFSCSAPVYLRAALNSIKLRSLLQHSVREVC